MNHYLLSLDDLQSIRSAITALAERVGDLEQRLKGTQPYPRQAAPPSSIMSSNGEFSAAEPRAASE